MQQCNRTISWRSTWSLTAPGTPCAWTRHPAIWRPASGCRTAAPCLKDQRITHQQFAAVGAVSRAGRVWVANLTLKSCRQQHIQHWCTFPGFYSHVALRTVGVRPKALRHRRVYPHRALWERCLAAVISILHKINIWQLHEQELATICEADQGGRSCAGTMVLDVDASSSLEGT